MNEVILNATHGAEDGTQLLTTLEARTRLRISKWKLYDLFRTNQLGSVHIGRRRFVPVDALRQYVQQLWRGSFA
ncbi:helix-turn-helix domain-containing protein [Streptomyces dysideae]|uniref:helix-turn-helix domain-containing protein n=1 Tax=Streptomyces dysideae TaxID=909626 RepID=UPI00099EBFA8|nr:helix-turn-helix domain-containing protein [Streptomyces dysideae]